MFVKKDLRKIPQILDAAAETNERYARFLSEPPQPNISSSVEHRNDDDVDEHPKPVKELRLSRRSAEFAGSISILCQPSRVPALRHLVSLSLYDCRISTLEGIGLLGSPVPTNANGGSDHADGSPSSPLSSVVCPNLREINVGRNPLTTLPDELSTLSGSLRELWCDDCKISGPLPDCVSKLHRLEVLRMSGNKIESVPDELGRMTELRVFALDGNELNAVPATFAGLEKLESLNLRQNKITQLPEGVPGRRQTKLTLLHVSSNRLTSLPDSIAECASLQSVYANGNAIKSVPRAMGERLSDLTVLNLSSNAIEDLPDDFEARFGVPDLKTGECSGDESCKVHIDRNPVVENARQMLKTQEEERRRIEEGAVTMDSS